jgi:hypothetical protein
MVAEFDGDLYALWQHLQKVQEEFRDRVVTGKPKPVPGDPSPAAPNC